MSTSDNTQSAMVFAKALRVGIHLLHKGLRRRVTLVGVVKLIWTTIGDTTI